MGLLAEETLNGLDGLKVLIIGAGFGGLACGIELRKRGASVHILESFPDMKKQGDVIMMGSNATLIMKRWGTCFDELLSCSSQPSTLAIADRNGKVILKQELPKDFNGNPNLYTSRGRTQEIMYNYAISLGVNIDFDARVTEVFENDNSAGVKAGGKEYVADFVIAADGVHSKARRQVTGIGDKPKRSGFAVYRSWFPLEKLRQKPKTQHIADSQDPWFQIWIAEDTHAIVTTQPKVGRATCFLTHKDTEDIKEDWDLAGNLEDMRSALKDWDPVLREVASVVPPECLIDYKLLWRDPVQKWISDKGRVALVGDAAHPHLATSGQGGAQAIEDAATIAALLGKFGSNQVPLALRAYARLREVVDIVPGNEGLLTGNADMSVLA